MRMTEKLSFPLILQITSQLQYQSRYLQFDVYSFIIHSRLSLAALLTLGESRDTLNKALVHHRADIWKQTTIHTHIHTYGEFLEPPIKLHVSGLWEEAWVPRGNPHTWGEHANSTQKGLTTHRSCAVRQQLSHHAANLICFIQNRAALLGSMQLCEWFT